MYNLHEKLGSPVTKSNETNRDEKNTCSDKSFEKRCSKTQPFARNFRGSVKASEIDLQNDTLAYPLHTSESRSPYSRFGNYSIAQTAEGRSFEKLPHAHKSYNETMP